MAKYQEILGRNRYSQSRRSYAFKKYNDGRYYSDCSSSVALAYKQAGYPFCDNSGNSCPNTVGMYQARSLQDVPVEIKKGVIQNPEMLRVGDMLLFAGSDNSRRYVDCVGHVEMVGKISGSKVTLYGHGSGTPRATEMNTYCRSRYEKKTGTVIGNRGLLKVRRFIEEDADLQPNSAGRIRVTAAVSAFVRKGPGVAYLPLAVVKHGEEFECSQQAENGWRCISVKGKTGWISPKMCGEI